MSLIITPGQLTRRAEFYHQLGATVGAGIPIIQSLEMLSKSPALRSDRPSLHQLILRLGQGQTFAEAVGSLGKWLPEFDVALLSAGEQSGRLDSCFRMLSDYYQERARLARAVLGDLAYPVFIFHLAILIFPPAMLKSLVWDGNMTGFFGAKLVQLVPLYVIGFLVILACQGRRGEAWRSWMEKVVRAIPVLGGARRDLALARLSAALEGLISAGVPIMEAWEMAAASCGSPALRRTVMGWRPGLLGGMTPAEVVRQSESFPDLFVSLYHTGEVSGQLDETLRRLYRHYQSEGSRKLHAVAQWMPRLVYIGLLLAVGYQVVAFWTNYYGDMLNQF